MSKISEQTKSFETRWSDSRGQTYKVKLDLKQLKKRPELLSVTVSAIRAGEFITQSTVRSIPLKALLKEALNPTKSLKATEPDFLIDGVEIELKSHRGRKPTHNELVVLVNLYEHAVKNHLPVLPTLSNALNLPESTVNKRLIVARKNGLLASRRYRPDDKTSGAKSRSENDKTVKRQRGS